MRYIILTFFALCLYMGAQAQKADSIFVKLDEKSWYVPYKSKANETIFSIAKRYHVPPAIMSDYNNLGYNQELVPGNKLSIPLAAYNHRAMAAGNTQPIYFRVTDDVSLGKIARASLVSQKTIQEWNKLQNTELRKGQVLLVGWLLYDAPAGNVVPAATKTPITSVKTPVKGNPYMTETVWIPPKKDTIVRDTLLPGEDQYLAQTNEGLTYTEEKGTAVFFKRVGKGDGVYFAFHNTARRGSIIKITNVGTEKTVYAKVIGTVPKTAAYYNAIIGISADARAALDVRDDKAWCEIRFAP